MGHPSVPAEKKERNRAIIEHIEAHKNISAAAREFGVSRQRVHQIKRKYLDIIQKKSTLE